MTMLNINHLTSCWTFSPSRNQTPSQSSLLSLQVSSEFSQMMALMSDNPQMNRTPGSNKCQKKIFTEGN